MTYGELWNPNLLATSRAVATLPLLFGAKGMLVAARTIHPAWGHANAAITHIDYAVQDVGINVAIIASTKKGGRL